MHVYILNLHICLSSTNLLETSLYISNHMLTCSPYLLPPSQDPRDQCPADGGGRDCGDRGCLLLPGLRQACVAVGGGAGGVGGGVDVPRSVHVCLHGEWEEEKEGGVKKRKKKRRMGKKTRNRRRRRRA